MTFDEMFTKAKAALTKATAASEQGHIAVQVNVSGEGSGIFYVEVTDGAMQVEPYDYKDHDAVLSAGSDALLKALTAPATAVELAMEGDAEKIAAFRRILATLPAPAAKKPAAAPKAAEKKPAPAAVTAAPKAVEKAAPKAAEKKPATTAAPAAAKPAATASTSTKKPAAAATTRKTTRKSK